MQKHQRNNILTWSIVLLFFLYIMAIFGLAKRSEGIFVFLTVPSLLITVVALVVNHFGEKEKVILHFIVFSVLLYFIEVLIINFNLTGKSYAKELLGFTFLGVPFIMGISGWISVYMGIHMVKKLKMNRLKKAIIGAAILVLLAWLAEPVGIKLGLWKYNGNFNPLNLLPVFIVNFLAIYFSRLIRFKKKNAIVVYVYMIFILFFIALNLILS